MKPTRTATKKITASPAIVIMRPIPGLIGCSVLGAIIGYVASVTRGQEIFIFNEKSAVSDFSS